MLEKYNSHHAPFGAERSRHGIGQTPARRKNRYVFGTVKVGDKGQIVIPKEARDTFGIHPGDTLLVLGDDENGLIVTRPEIVSEMASRIFKSIDST